MRKILSSIVLSLFAGTASAQDTEQTPERVLDFDRNGIAISYNEPHEFRGYESAYYELETRNGCSAGLSIAEEYENQNALKQLDGFKKKLYNALDRGTLTDLFRDRNFIETTTGFYYGCPEDVSDNFPGKGIDKRDRAVHMHRDNGDILSVVFSNSSGWPMQDVITAMLDGADHTHAKIEFAVGAEYIGCDWHGTSFRERYTASGYTPEDFEPNGRLYNENDPDFRWPEPKFCSQ